jgi:hypothetical protein
MHERCPSALVLFVYVTSVSKGGTDRLSAVLFMSYGVTLVNRFNYRRSLLWGRRHREEEEDGSQASGATEFGNH